MHIHYYVAIVRAEIRVEWVNAQLRVHRHHVKALAECEGISSATACLSIISHVAYVFSLRLYHMACPAQVPG